MVGLNAYRYKLDDVLTKPEFSYLVLNSGRYSHYYLYSESEFEDAYFAFKRLNASCNNRDYNAKMYRVIERDSGEYMLREIDAANVTIDVSCIDVCMNADWKNVRQEWIERGELWHMF